MAKYSAVTFIVVTFLLVTACGTETPTGNTSPPTESVRSEVIAEATDDSNKLPATNNEAVAEADVQTATSTSTATATVPPTATGTPVPTATPVPQTPTPTDAPEVIEVNAENGVKVNVRGGPGTNYPVIGQLMPGEEVTVTGYNSDQTWWQINFAGTGSTGAGWVYSDVVDFSGDISDLAQAETPPTPVPPTPEPVPPAPESATAETNDASGEDVPVQAESTEAAAEAAEPKTSEELADSLRCGKDFCVTYQAMVPIWENGGCIGNHSIYVTVLEGPPPGRPLDGIVLGDTFGNVEVASGSKGPGTAEFTLWMNSMSVKVKRHIDGTEFTSEESFPFTSHDELIPAEVLAANGYCDGSIEKCRAAQQQNQVCRGHYSWRVTFHKFD